MKLISELNEFLRIVFGLLSRRRRLAILLLFLSILLAGISTLPALATKVLFDSLQLNRFGEATRWVIIALALLVGADLGRLVNAFLVQKFQAQIAVWLRERFARSLYATTKLLDAKWDQGYVLSRYAEINDLNSLMLETVATILTQILVFLVALSFFIVWIPTVSILVLLFSPLTGYLALKMKKTLERKATTFQENDAKTNERLGEIIQKWQPSLFYSRDLLLNRHGNSLQSLFKAFVSYQASNYRYQCALHGLNGLLLGVFWFMGVSMLFAGRLTLGVLAAGNTFIGQCTSAMQSVVVNVGQISFALAAYRRVAEFIETKARSTGLGLQEKVTSIHFENVSLRYNENSIIDGFSLNCNREEWIVCVGENGTGKTSLLRLVAGLVIPTKGRIAINGHLDAPFFSEQWMERIIFTEPQPFIIDGTIKENITLESIPFEEERLRSIFESIGYRRFWQELPSGFDTQIHSSQDSILSSGQRQLVEWVRWLVHPARDLFLLDEPLSAVVPEMRRRCLAELRAHTRDSIAIVTTQDPQFEMFAEHVLRFRKFIPVTIFHKSRILAREENASVNS